MCLILHFFHSFLHSFTLSVNRLFTEHPLLESNSQAEENEWRGWTCAETSEKADEMAQVQVRRASRGDGDRRMS